VPVVFLIAIAVVLVGIFFAATGRGGELAYEHADHAPLDLGPVSAADIALLRPPTAMWGYNMQVTDAALDQIARAMRERDITIAYLQEQVATYERNGSYAEPRGVHARLASDAEPLDALDPPGTLDPLAIPGSSGAPTNPDPMEPVGAMEPPGVLEPHEGPLESYDAPEPSDTLEPSGTPDAPESRQSWEPVETPDTREPLESPEPVESPVTLESPETLTAAEPSAAPTTEAPGQPRTSLVLKASAPKPEPDEPTQPSAVVRDDEESREATQPSATLAADEVPGPQGAFDTHGWWAEQQEAAREEQARRHAAGEQDDESVAAAEEQGW
jgi:hypothetical protein